MKKTDTGGSKSKGSLSESDIKQGFKKMGKILIGPGRAKIGKSSEHKIPGVES